MRVRRIPTIAVATLGLLLTACPGQQPDTRSPPASGGMPAQALRVDVARGAVRVLDLSEEGDCLAYKPPAAHQWQHSEYARPCTAKHTPTFVPALRLPCSSKSHSSHHPDRTTPASRYGDQSTSESRSHSCSKILRPAMLR